MSRSYGTAKFPMKKKLFAKFIEKYSDDNFVFNPYLCQFYDMGGMLQKSATLANDINWLVCRHPLHLDLQFLKSSLSQYDVAWVIFFYYLSFIWNFADVIFIVCFVSVL